MYMYDIVRYLNKKVVEYKSYTNTIKKSQNTSVRIKQTENYRKKFKYTIQVIETNRKSLEKAESGKNINRKSLSTPVIM